MGAVVIFYVVLSATDASGMRKWMGPRDRSPEQPTSMQYLIRFAIRASPSASSPPLRKDRDAHWVNYIMQVSFSLVRTRIDTEPFNPGFTHNWQVKKRRKGLEYPHQT